jgi:hypothetical protein
VFKVTNTQRLTGIANNGVALDVGLLKLTAPLDWSNSTQIQGQPRVMQVGVRYSFKANRVLELNTAGPEMAQFHLLGIPGVPQTADWPLAIC